MASTSTIPMPAAMPAGPKNDHRFTLHQAAKWIWNHIPITDPQYRLGDSLYEIAGDAKLPKDMATVGRIRATVILIENTDPDNVLGEQLQGLLS